MNTEEQIKKISTILDALVKECPEFIDCADEFRNAYVKDCETKTKINKLMDQLIIECPEYSITLEEYREMIHSVEVKSESDSESESECGENCDLFTVMRHNDHGVGYVIKLTNNKYTEDEMDEMLKHVLNVHLKCECGALVKGEKFDKHLLSKKHIKFVNKST